jgi:hypothetical protein
MNNLQIHETENNNESQGFLNENHERIKECCMKVLRILNQGKKLSVLSAHSEYGISSLPRRIKDLRDVHGIRGIKDEWVTDAGGKRLYKQWYRDIRPHYNTKSDLQQWWDEYQKEMPKKTYYQPELL